MTWLNGSCTVYLLHLALISPVLVCRLCFWALKSCDHLKNPTVSTRSCLLFIFFFVLLFNGLLFTFVSGLKWTSSDVTVSFTDQKGMGLQMGVIS